MKKRSSTSKLNEEIQILKEQQAKNLKLLVTQFHHTYENLKPVNLLKSTISEVVSSPFLMDNILVTSLGLASGYLSKKIIVAGSDNKFRKLLGSVFQFGVSNIVTKNPEAIKSISHLIYKKIFHKKQKLETLPKT
jgi:hypothetical protein